MGRQFIGVGKVLSTISGTPCECGSHIVASSSIYGGTFNLIAVTMAKMGITATFVSPDCTEEELNTAFQDNTRAVFGETIANPALTVLDIEKFAACPEDVSIAAVPPSSSAILAATWSFVGF